MSFSAVLSPGVRHAGTRVVFLMVMAGGTGSVFETPQSSSSVAWAPCPELRLCPQRPAKPGAPARPGTPASVRWLSLLSQLSGGFKSRDPMTLTRRSRFPTPGAVGPWASGEGNTPAWDFCPQLNTAAGVRPAGEGGGEALAVGPEKDVGEAMRSSQAACTGGQRGVRDRVLAPSLVVLASASPSARWGGIGGLWGSPGPE